MTSSPRNSSRSSRGISSLHNLEIPGAVGPLSQPPAGPGQTLWGINHGAALDNFPQNGLLLYIPAWSNMNIGDSVSVLLSDSVPVLLSDSVSVLLSDCVSVLLGDSVSKLLRDNVSALLRDSASVVLEDKVVNTEYIAAPEQVNQRVTVFVEARHLVPGNHILKYRVTQFGQNPEFSADTDILVKLDRPGGQDQDGEIPGHSALKFTLPQDIIDGGVDAETAENGVPVTITPYLNMTAGDVIKLSWGGQRVEHTVTSGEVDQPIEITVVEEVISAAGDSDSVGLAVTFEVYDVVQNRSEDWAAEIRIVVDTKNLRLGSPIVREAVNNVLDLDALAGGPVKVQVWASNNREMPELPAPSFSPEQAPQFQAMGRETLSGPGEMKADFVLGDFIVVKLTGTTADGQEVKHEAPPYEILTLPQAPDIEVPNAVIRQLAQTQAAFSYELRHKDNSTSVSKKAFVSVVGEAVRMAAPIALDAEQGAIDPTLTNTTVQIPWDDDMAAGDQVILEWFGTRPDFSSYHPVLSPHNITNGEATNKPPIIFTVPGVHLKAIEGGTLVLYFTLAKVVDGTIVNRESARALELTVGEPRAELPAPLVEGVVDGGINPDYGPTTLTVPVYRDMAIGDEVHYVWLGSLTSLPPDWVVVSPLTKDKPIPISIPSTAISSNDGGSVEASYWVQRVGTNRRSDSEVLTFSVGQPVALDPPVISSIKDPKGQEIPNGGTTTETSITLTGTAAPDLDVEVFDGTVSKGTATADNAGQWTLPVSGLDAGSHVMTAKALYGGGEVSPARGFTVSAFVAPTLSSIKNLSGAEIPEGSVTLETSVTVTGTANGGLQVEVFDGSTSKGNATANTNGQWSLTITGLTVAVHAIKAKALYGSGSESAVRSFSVIRAVPLITSIKDSSGSEIPDNGSTSERILTFAGSSYPGSEVKLYDAPTPQGEGELIGTTLADDNGQWAATWTIPERYQHVVWILGGGIPSSTRQFTLG